MVGLLTRFALFVLMLQGPGVLAQVADPTRPPAGMVSAPESGEGGGMPPAKVLQSVLMPKNGKPVAIIGGQAVRLGEKHGDSRLVRLTEREAVLEGPSGVERLLLTPEVEKVSVEERAENATTAAKTGKRGGKR